MATQAMAPTTTKKKNTTTTTRTRAARRRERTDVLTEEQVQAAAERVNLADLNIGTSFADKVRQGCTVVALHLTKAGKFRKLRDSEYEVAPGEENAEVREHVKKRTGAAKRLFDNEAYARIASIQGEARRFMQEHEIKCTVVGDGKHLISLKLVPVVHERLSALLVEHNAAVEAFINDYDAIIAAEKEALGPLFHARDYPSRDALIERFQMVWAYEEFAVSEGVRTIDAAIYEQQVAQHRARLEADMATMRAALREGFSKVVDAMVERLQPDVDGGVKHFKNSLVDNITECLGLFDYKNIHEDAQLEALVAKARKVLAGVQPDDLRHNTGTREAVLKAMEGIAGKLDQFVEVRTRKITRIVPPQ